MLMCTLVLVNIDAIVELEQMLSLEQLHGWTALLRARDNSIIQ